MFMFPAQFPVGCAGCEVATFQAEFLVYMYELLDHDFLKKLFFFVFRLFFEKCTSYAIFSSVWIYNSDCLIFSFLFFICCIVHPELFDVKFIVLS